MPRFLIELEHNDDYDACVKAVSTLLSTGSHFITNTDWGCSDGEHKAWVIVDMENKEQARGILPPSYRSTAKIIKLSRFTMEEMDKIILSHRDSLPHKNAEKSPSPV